jgi:serine/threonine-protein kinase
MITLRVVEYVPDGANPTLPASSDEDVEPSAFVPGSLVGEKYRIEGRLARGGIGVVVAARHVALEQRVAIKHLTADALTNTTLVARFAREAKLAAQIESEHVVRVHDVGEDSRGGPYIVMELLSGTDLERRLESGPLPIASAIDYVLQACDALGAAHVRGIVHRDIKPANLFLAERPGGHATIKVIDFGISKVMPAREPRVYLTCDTANDESLGTPVYMSPEALRSSSEIDERTDIWSLGVVLYELLTGASPFEGHDLPTLCTSITTSPPRQLRDVRAGLPPGLEQAVLRCLEKDTRRRFRDVLELAEALAPYGPADAKERVDRIRDTFRRSGRDVRPPLAEFVPIPRRKRYALAVVGAALAFAVGALPASRVRRPDVPIAARASRASPVAAPVETASPPVSLPAIVEPVAAKGDDEAKGARRPLVPARKSAPRAAPAAVKATAQSAPTVSPPDDPRAQFGERE